ncbi:diguanylate cyclase domain-containing protein [Lentzea sp. NPDC060358]|uniref:diguanylate cyclase domain-containing protein n=1 Tax=Lentzea sp. NPDC060358 TaxID=3347103 RepID=UPI003661FCBB
MTESSVDSDHRQWELTRDNGDTVWANVVLSVLHGSDGLPNRASFTEELESALATGDPHTLAHLDVGSLTIVDGGLGYAAGDAVLAEVARRLRVLLHGFANLSTVDRGPLRGVLLAPQRRRGWHAAEWLSWCLCCCRRACTSSAAPATGRSA